MSEQRELTTFKGEVAGPAPGGCVIRYKHRGQTCEVACRSVLPVGTGVMFTIASDSGGEHAVVASAGGSRLFYDNSDLTGSWWGPLRSERER